MNYTKVNSKITRIMCFYLTFIYNKIKDKTQFFFLGSFSSFYKNRNKNTGFLMITALESSFYREC